MGKGQPFRSKCGAGSVVFNLIIFTGMFSAMLGKSGDEEDRLFSLLVLNGKHSVFNFKHDSNSPLFINVFLSSWKFIFSLSLSSQNLARYLRSTFCVSTHISMGVFFTIATVVCGGQLKHA